MHTPSHKHDTSPSVTLYAIPKHSITILGLNGITILPLGLLLGGNDLEVTRVQRLLLLLLLLLLQCRSSAGATLLGDLRPSTTSGLVLGGRSSVALIDDAFFSQLATAQELLRKVARVKRVGGGMH